MAGFIRRHVVIRWRRSIGRVGVLQRLAVAVGGELTPFVEADSMTTVSDSTPLAVSAASIDRGRTARRPVCVAPRARVLHDPTPIFSASLLAAVREVRASRTWTGVADSGRMALIDHRDVAEAAVFTC